MASPQASGHLLARAVKASFSGAVRSCHYKPIVASPADATLQHEGGWYKVPEEVVEALMMDKYEFLNRNLWKQRETFGSLSLMLRRPFLDVADNLERLDLGNPAVRFVLYGPQGVGKSTTLSQVAHWGIARGWSLLYFPNAMRLGRPKLGIAMSSSTPGRIDTPLESSQWLARFKTHNAHCLPTLQGIPVSQEYVWSKRERTEQGASVMDVVELGVNQAKYASDAVAVVVKELKLAASAGRHRLLVLADRVNALFVASRVKREDGTFADAGDLSAVRSARAALRNDWSGGAVVATTDEAELLNRLERPPTTPVSLLMAEGFEVRFIFTLSNVTGSVNLRD